MPDKGVYGGYIVFTPQGGGQVYRVPYAGFKGDYQSIQVLIRPAGSRCWPGSRRATHRASCRGSECFGGGTYNVPPAADAYTFVNGAQRDADRSSSTSTTRRAACASTCTG